MKQYEKIKIEIAECNSAMEMVGFLNGLTAAAIIYCQNHHPEEISRTETGESELSIYGMQYFWDSES